MWYRDLWRARRLLYLRSTFVAVVRHLRLEASRWLRRRARGCTGWTDAIWSRRPTAMHASAHIFQLTNCSVRFADCNQSLRNGQCSRAMPKNPPPQQTASHGVRCVGTRLARFRLRPRRHRSGARRIAVTRDNIVRETNATPIRHLGREGASSSPVRSQRTVELVCCPCKLSELAT